MDSPYLLLLGALYSCSCAELFRIPQAKISYKNLWREMREHLLAKNLFAVNPIWAETYFLNNAIFRISSAIEKLVLVMWSRLEHKAIPNNNQRSVFWTELRNEKSKICLRLPELYSFLGRPRILHGASKARPHQVTTFLLTQRHRVLGGRKIQHPLYCCLEQADLFKHAPSLPTPEAGQFYWSMAAGGFLQAVTILSRTLRSRNDSSH